MNPLRSLWGWVKSWFAAPHDVGERCKITGGPKNAGCPADKVCDDCDASRTPDDNGPGPDEKNPDPIGGAVHGPSVFALSKINRTDPDLVAAVGRGHMTVAQAVKTAAERKAKKVRERERMATRPTRTTNPAEDNETEVTHVPDSVIGPLTIVDAPPASSAFSFPEFFPAPVPSEPGATIADYTSPPVPPPSPPAPDTSSGAGNYGGDTGSVGGGDYGGSSGSGD